MTEAKPKPTRSQEVAADVAALLRARNPLIWIVTREESRVERYIFEACAAARYTFVAWDCAAGVTDFNSIPIPRLGSPKEPSEMLDLIRSLSQGGGSSQERRCWVLRDLPTWIQGFPGASPLRMMRNLCRSLPGVPRDNAQAMIVISAGGDVPQELSANATVIEWPLPDRAEIGAILDASIPEQLRAEAMPNGTRDAAIDAAVGLTGEEASACFARSLVQLRRIDPATIAAEKKRVIAREKILEWVDPIPGGLDAVGGLDQLKAWLASRKLAYSPQARAYGLPAPKGALLVGIPGCGKSLVAKAIATAWGVPLLKFDLGALKSKFVGESEQNLRKAFKVAEAIGRCVMWFDEVEKALQGATSGSADGGVSADALGAVLTWMQERRGEGFILATSNDVSALPPELLRKGRFDEVWWVDLPIPSEREAILSAALRARGRKPEGIDLTAIAEMTAGFIGAEIDALVPEALFAAFADGGREPTTADLALVASQTTPLSKTAAEKITKLREWAPGRARNATSATASTTTQSTGRALDF